MLDFSFYIVGSRSCDDDKGEGDRGVERLLLLLLLLVDDSLDIDIYIDIYIEFIILYL